MKEDLGEPDPRYQALIELLRTADTVWNASRAFFERWKLGPSQFDVLNLLHSTPNGLSQSELGRQLIMHRSNVTGLVDRLEKRGLVERKDAAADRRAYRVVLTGEGDRLVRDILPRYHESAWRVLDGLTAKRAQGLATDLRQIALNIERIKRGQGAAENG